VQFGHRSLIGIGVEVDDDPDRGESRVPIGEAEEGVQVDVAIEGNPQVADLDACHRGVGGVTDCEAVAQGTEQLLDRVWGYDYFGDGRLVDVHIRRLRTKVEVDPAVPQHILTVRGMGYKLVP